MRQKPARSLPFLFFLSFLVFFLPPSAEAEIWRQLSAVFWTVFAAACLPACLPGLEVVPRCDGCYLAFKSFREAVEFPVCR